MLKGFPFNCGEMVLGALVGTMRLLPGETLSQELSNEHELHSALPAKQSLIGTVIRGDFGC